MAAWGSDGGGRAKRPGGIRRGLPRLVAAAGLGAALAAGSAMLAPETYVAEAQLLAASADAVPPSAAMMLTSREFARRVAGRLELADQPEFVGGGGSLLVTAGRVVGLVEDPLRTSPEERVLTAFMDRLGVVPVDGGLALRFSAQDPELARDGANAVAEEFLALSRDRRASPDEEASRLLAEIGRVEARIAELEAASAAPAPRPGQHRLQQELADAEAAVADAEARVQAIDAISAGRHASADFGADAGTSALAALAARVASLGTRVDELSATLLPAHPALKAIVAEFEAARARVAAESRRLRAIAAQEAAVRGAEAETLRAALAAERAAADADGATEALATDAAFQRALLDDLTRRLAERRAAAAAAPTIAPIVVRATTPSTPAGWSVGRFALAGALGGLGLALTAFGLGALRPRRDRRRLAAGADDGGAAMPAPVDMPAPPPARDLVPPLAGDDLARPANDDVPPASGEDAALWGDAAIHPPVVAAAALDRAADDEADAVPLDALRATLLADGASTIAVVSLVASGPGIDLVAASIGDSAAAEGLRAIVVETVHVADGPAPGLSELLDGKVGFSGVITRHPRSRAHWIPAGGAVIDEAMIGSAQLRTVLEALEMTYDLVLLDLGPLGDAPGRLGLVAAADHVVLITGADEEAQAVSAALMRSGITSLSRVSARDVAAKLAA